VDSASTELGADGTTVGYPLPRQVQNFGLT
jgi:hypothetical protein